MGYCTIAQLRAEGLPTAVADDTRAQSLIDDASDTIDTITGWWFAERDLTLKLSGRDTPKLHLPAPATAVTEVRRVYRSTDPDTTEVIDADYYVVVSTDLPEHRYNPHLALIAQGSGLVYDDEDNPIKWYQGVLNYEVDGTFGFVDDGLGGTTPRAIRKACTILALHNAKPRWGGGPLDESFAREAGDLRSLNVEGRTATWGGASSSGTASGVPEVDQILAKYRCPMRVGIA